MFSYIARLKMNHIQYSKVEAGQLSSKLCLLRSEDNAFSVLNLVYCTSKR